MNVPNAFNKAYHFTLVRKAFLKNPIEKNVCEGSRVVPKITTGQMNIHIEREKECGCDIAPAEPSTGTVHSGVKYRAYQVLAEERMLEASNNDKLRAFGEG